MSKKISEAGWKAKKQALIKENLNASREALSYAPHGAFFIGSMSNIGEAR